METCTKGAQVNPPSPRMGFCQRLALLVGAPLFLLFLSQWGLGLFLPERGHPSIFHHPAELAFLVAATGVIYTLMWARLDRARGLARLAAGQREEAESQWQAIFDLSLDMVCILGTDGYFKKVNPACTAILGYSPEELLQTPYLCFVHEEDRADTEARMEALLQGRSVVDFTNRYRAKDGSCRWLQWRLVPFANKPLIAAIARDITEEYLRCAALAESEQRFSLFMDYLPMCAFIMDASGRIQFVNRKAEQDFHAKDWLGRTIEEIFPDETGKHMHLRSLEALEEGSSCAEEALTAPDGRRLVCRTVRFAIPRADGSSLLGVIGEDVTDERRKERELQALSQSNRELARSLMRAQERERRTIARELHDEMGQYLTGIRADAQVILKTSLDAGAAVVARSARTIEEAAIRLQDLARSLIRQLRPVVLDQRGLRGAIEDMLDNWCRQHPAIACGHEIADDLPDLTEEASIAIYRTAQEALTNIARHSGARRARLRLRRISSNGEAADRVELEVSDDGVGLRAPAGANGMGLAGMRERMRALGGEVHITERAEGGVRLCAWIPLSIAARKKNSHIPY